MQPFSVFCETCGAKLKVRDPAVVGQIHSCPKCESMVLIAVPAAASSFPSPPAVAAPVESSAGDGTIAPDDFATEIDDLLQQPTPAPEPVAESAPTEVPEPDLSEPQAAEPAAEEPVASAETLVASGTSRTAFYVWGTAGCVGCFALGLLAAAWWTRGGDEPQAAQVASITERPEPESAVELTEEQPSEEVSVNKPTVEVEPEPEEPAEPVVEPEAETPAPELPPVEPLPELPSLDDTEPAAPEPTEPKPKRLNLAPLDPLAVDSANLDLLLIPDGDTEVTADAPVEFGPEEPMDTEPPEVDLPEPKNIRFEPGTASRGPSYAEPLADGELASRLEMKLPGVAWKRTPLVVAVRELEQLSGVPITVRPADLQMAGITAVHEVSVSQENATVRQLAAELAKAARLKAQTTPHGLALVRAGAEKWRAVGAPQYDIADLAKDADEANALADLIQQVVAPESWKNAQAKLAVDGTALKVRQQLNVHYDLLRFLERLRMARGLPTRSQYPKSMLTIEPRLASMKKQLARPTTFAFVDWTPLGEVQDYWSDVSGLTVLADWDQLADSDLRPLATMAGSVDNVAFGDALDRCLVPLDMGWTVTDGSTLQLTTLAAADRACWVEFYIKADADKLREQIETTVEPQFLQQFVLQADPSGRFVLVYGNRHVHQAALK